jgi:hypothetical protein
VAETLGNASHSCLVVGALAVGLLVGASAVRALVGERASPAAPSKHQDDTEQATNPVPVIH